MKSGTGAGRAIAFLALGVFTLCAGVAMGQSAPIPASKPDQPSQPSGDKPAEVKPAESTDSTKKQTSTGDGKSKKEPPPVKVAAVVYASHSLQHDPLCDRCLGSGTEIKTQPLPSTKPFKRMTRPNGRPVTATCDACKGLKVDKAEKVGHIIKDLAGALDKIDVKQKEWEEKQEQIKENLGKAARISVGGWAQRLGGYRAKVQSGGAKSGDAILLAGVVQSDVTENGKRAITVKIGPVVKHGLHEGTRRWFVEPGANTSTITITDPRIVVADVGSPVLVGGTAEQIADGTIALRRGFVVQGS